MALACARAHKATQQACSGGPRRKAFPDCQPTPYNSRHSSFVMPGPQSRLRRRLGFVCGAKLGHDAINTKMEKADGDDDEWASPAPRAPRGCVGKAQRP